MASRDLNRLITLLTRSPGLGPRSARRLVLHLLQDRSARLDPLIAALQAVASRVMTCTVCGNLDERDPCSICADAERSPAEICVVEGIEDLWAFERSSVFRGRYHVLGGTLSALDGVRPDNLRIDRLLDRLAPGSGVKEVVIALGATIEGQTTAHYLRDRIAPLGVEVTRLGHGVPLGGQLPYLDEGTLTAAFRGRQPVSS